MADRSYIEGIAGARVWWALTVLFALCLWCEAGEAKPAELKIRGYGWLGNWQMKRVLKTIEGNQLKTPSLGADTIEDSALVLMAQLKKNGYLHPTVRARLTLMNGQVVNVLWRDIIEPPLQRPLAAQKVRFTLRKGVRYHYSRLRFEGLTAIPEKQARSFFVQTGFLISFAGTRLYTPSRLNRGLSSITDELDRLGFRQATAQARVVAVNDRNGAVDVVVSVRQGLKTLVRSVEVRTLYPTGEPFSERWTIRTNAPYSRTWEQDLIQRIRATNYHRGYPEPAVLIEVLHSNAGPARIEVDLLTMVRTGPQMWIGQIKFQGQKRTRVNFMKSRVPLQEGDLLDPVLADRGRNRLARLGTFNSVELRYDQVDPNTRDLIYSVKESRPLQVSLLAGWGSYEMARGGFEVREQNIFGRAHQASIRVIQSVKASRGQFNYTIPDLLGEDVDVFSHGFGLRREEVSFTREEYGGGAGVHRFFRRQSTDVSVRYTYQVLNALELGNDFAPVGLTNAGVGSIIADIRYDRRDDPLYPRRGYHVLGMFETASPYLASDAAFQRLELSGAYHQPLVGGLHASIALSHGLIAANGSALGNIPFNKRFFPGGENSIRGYQESEASPRDSTGKIIGAETYMLGTVELEQALTPRLSLVVFSDNLGASPSLRSYPWNKVLHSAGGGLRLRTIVGPVRLEYGHNLNPRPHDPSGTIHFSLGFPF